MTNWEKNIRKVVPYTPGEQPNQPDMIKLNTNENPYPPAPKVQQVLKEMEAGELRLYPDPSAGALVRAIADYYGLKEEQVFVGVGSDDVLAMSFLTFFNGEKPVLFPDITYSFYDVWAELFRIPYERPALDDNFHIKKEDYFKENGGIIFPNPNAPTGVELPLQDIEEILKANLAVIRRVYGRKAPDPCLKTFAAPLDTAAARVALADSITLTPGTITAEQEGAVFTVHCLDRNMSEGLESSGFVRRLQAMEKQEAQHEV